MKRRNLGWYKREPDKALSGKMGLTLEERGAYDTIIDLIYAHAGQLQHDENLLRYWFGTDIRVVRRLVDRLVELDKIQIRGGIIHTRKSDELIADRIQVLDQKRRAAEARWENSEAKPPVQLELGTDLAPVRAHGEPDFQPTSGELPANLQQTSGKLTGKVSPSYPPKSEPKPAEILEKPDASAYPGGSLRAREESESESESLHNTSQCSVIPGRLGNADLHQLYEAVCRASGFATSSPGAIDRAMRQIEKWKADGIDFDKIIIPVITRTMQTSDEPTRVLGRFDKAIRHEHARLTARSQGGKPMEPAAPILFFDGEDQRITPLRQDLLKALGPRTYQTYAHGCRFEITDSGALRIVDNRNPVLRLYDSDRIPKVRAVAAKHGFAQVW